MKHGILYKTINLTTNASMQEIYTREREGERVNHDLYWFSVIVLADT